MSEYGLVVFISGTGSNLLAILEAIESGVLKNVAVKAVIADKDASGLQHARERRIPTHIVELKADRKLFDEQLRDITASYEPELVVLAGFMRLLGEPMLSAFKGRIINTHPALLPAFPGAHGVRDALAYGVKITGATVIEVDAGIDTGRIIEQRSLRIKAGESEAELHERIKVIERQMLVEVINRLKDSGSQK